MLYTLLQLIRGGADPVTEIFPYLLGLMLALVFGIAVHEFSHAFAADRLGDLTPRYQGRLTLNPAAHLDPMGMLLFAIAGFGWGRPVQFNPLRLRTNPRTGGAIVAIAGPISNVLMGTIVGLALRAMLTFDLIPTSEALGKIIYITLYSFVQFNFVLAIFNLVPLPPLDGHHILPALLPTDMAYGLENLYRQIAPFSLFLLFALLWVLPGVGNILFAPVDAMMRLVLGSVFF